jgi:hypothetical protein
LPEASTTPPFGFEFLLRLEIAGGPPNELGETPYGRRRVVGVEGGRFEGPRLRGDILPFGGDTALIRSDGVFIPDVRMLLRCDDGALIYLTYRGVWHALGDGLERLLRRQVTIEEVGAYFRTAAFFETSHPDYVWLNRILALGAGAPRPGTRTGTAYDLYAVS